MGKCFICLSGYYYLHESCIKKERRTKGLQICNDSHNVIADSLIDLLVPVMCGVQI